MSSIPDNFLGGILSGPLPGGQFEPQRTDGGLLRIQGVQAYGDSAQLTLSLRSFPLPKVQTNQNVIPYLNEVRKFAGRTTWSDMTVSFHDYVDRSVATILWNWKYAIHNPRTGYRGLKQSYAKMATIDVFAPDNDTSSAGSGAARRSYTIENIWPQELDLGQH